MNYAELAKQNLIFLTTTGSHAYGTNIETSDTDYRGLFFGDKRNVLTPFFPVEQVEGFQGEKDSVVYELTKFMEMWLNQNPNILELMWVEERFIKKTSKIYLMLRAQREKFLTSKCAFTFSGYAHSQLQRIKGHNKWINNEQPKRRPKEIDFVSVVWNQTSRVEYNKKVPFENFQAYLLGDNTFGLVRTDGHTWHDVHEALVYSHLSEKKDDAPLDIIVKFNRQLYKEHVDNWKSYWDWKKNRNEARSELEAKHGYDTKHAMHLVRLLRMGKEILKGEGVKVWRDDHEELLAIRNGTWKYEELVAYATGLMTDIEELYKITELQKTVDPYLASEVLMDAYELCWTGSF
jgi:predicted nucleotidyltransferase